jgi:hypothetical protein
MRYNIGLVDRGVRLAAAVGMGLLIYGNVVMGGFAVLFGCVAVFLGVSALIGWCAFYAIFGVTTCKRYEEK